MTQKLAPGVGAGGVVVLLVIVTLLLPIGAAGWLTMSGVVRSVAGVGDLVSCASSASSQRHRLTPGHQARAQ